MSYILFTEQLQIVSLWGTPDSPLSLQHLQLVDVSSLAALHGRHRVHCELLHPDNTSVTLRCGYCNHRWEDLVMSNNTRQNSRRLRPTDMLLGEEVIINATRGLREKHLDETHK